MQTTSKNKSIYSDYKVTGLKNSHQNSRLGIGYILQCTKGDDFGMVYGYHSHRRSGASHITWIYFFKKPQDLVYEKFTEITFMKSSSGFDKSESFQVSDILPLSCYKIINEGDEKLRGKARSRTDGRYRYDIEWNQMIMGEPYICLSSYSAINIYFPIIDTDCKSVVFHDCTVYRKGQDASILSCYIGMYDLRSYSNVPKFDYVSSRLEAIKDYVERFNIKRETLKFIAGQSGYYHCYPGRDDSFFMTNYWRSSSSDSYVNQLVDLREDKWYSNCCGRSDDDYDRIDSKETDLMRAEILRKYDKDAHYMYLLNEFWDDLKKKREQYRLYEECIKSFIEKGDEELFTQRYNENEYLKFIEQYNRK